MAKKPTKSTRRARAKKEQVNKKATTKQTQKRQKPAVAETEIVTQEENTISESPIVSEELAESEIQQEITDLVQPQRRRALIYGAVLTVVAVALVRVAMTIHRPNNQSSQAISSGGASERADQILQSGGNVCTNGASQTDLSGSTKPGSVGMMLQNVPANDIQTPQGVSGVDDTSVLQGAACF
jgi:ferric-dicitrate binding protein FerR (iron transport regulator)